uniref:methylated-DNA--[protein]-cysteine S-methyltransferase n=1 Tax=Dysosmobacter welbionis TaxID=2093857 RepID=UPI003FEDF9CC
MWMIFHKPSPVGMLTLSSDGTALTGLWLDGQKYFGAGLPNAVKENDLPVFEQASAWLDAYFAKAPLPALPPLAPQGSPFRQAVWRLLLEIPYGTVTTYGALARTLRDQGISAAAQAVGGAVGHNPISILIPCHRVVGSDGSLTGYAGGVANKQFLLELEGVDMTGLYVPLVARRCETQVVSMAHTRKKMFYAPKAFNGYGPPEPPIPAAQDRPGRYPCPCCGQITLPVPPEEAVAYICPVCWWENDVFISSDNEPSDENHGLTLSQGRENVRRFGTCDPRMKR